ncbi:hypothetical protein K504DRAFT_483942, partial [Pleomassaria siparia CBS 279.74]
MGDERPHPPRGHSHDTHPPPPPPKCSSVSCNNTLNPTTDKFNNGKWMKTCLNCREISHRSKHKRKSTATPLIGSSASDRLPASPSPQTPTSSGNQGLQRLLPSFLQRTAPMTYQTTAATSNPQTKSGHNPSVGHGLRPALSVPNLRRAPTVTGLPGFAQPTLGSIGRTGSVRRGDIPFTVTPRGLHSSDTPEQAAGRKRMLNVQRENRLLRREGVEVPPTPSMSHFLQFPTSSLSSVPSNLLPPSSSLLQVVTPWNIDEGADPDAGLPVPQATATPSNRGRGRSNSVATNQSRSRTPSPIAPRASMFICNECNIPRSTNRLYIPAGNVCYYCIPDTALYGTTMAEEYRWCFRCGDEQPRQTFFEDVDTMSGEEFDFCAGHAPHTLGRSSHTLGRSSHTLGRTSPTFGRTSHTLGRTGPARTPRNPNQANFYSSDYNPMSSQYD